MSRPPMVKLEELMATRQGSVDPSKFEDEMFELYSIPAFDSLKPEVLAGGAIGSTKQLVGPRDVLLSKIVPHIRRSWIVGAKGENRQIASGEWIVFRSDRVVPEYLRHALVCDEFHAQFMQTVSGIGGSLLRARPAQVAKIQVPLPLVPEQQRIAAILDKAVALRSKRREALAQLDSLAQSIFVEMFGDPVTGPKNCARKKLADCVASLEYGPRFYDEAYSEEGVRIVRITDLDHSGTLDFEAMPRMNVDEQTIRRFALEPGDIVFARTGATVGKVALIRDVDPLCIAGAYFIRLRFDDSVLPIYAASVLRAKSVQELIAKQSRQAAQQNFSGPGLRSLPMPIPPMSAQQAYANQVRKILIERKKLDASLAEMNRLFSSLQHRAFQGAL